MEVHVDYTSAAADAFLKSLAPHLPAGKKFRFVYTSGGAVPYLDSPALFLFSPQDPSEGMYPSSGRTIASMFGTLIGSTARS